MDVRNITNDLMKTTFSARMDSSPSVERLRPGTFTNNEDVYAEAALLSRAARPSANTEHSSGSPVPSTLISVRSWAMIFWLGLVSPRYPKMTIRSGGAHCKSSPHGQRRKLPRIFVELLLAIYPPTSRGRQRKLRSRQLHLFHHRLQDRCHRGLALRRASRFHDDRRAMLRPRILSLRRGPM